VVSIFFFGFKSLYSFVVPAWEFRKHYFFEGKLEVNPVLDF